MDNQSGLDLRIILSGYTVAIFRLRMLQFHSLRVQILQPDSRVQAEEFVLEEIFLNPEIQEFLNPWMHGLRILGPNYISKNPVRLPLVKPINL
jgi:hypothetical protein